jgi:hypothetical protein
MPRQSGRASPRRREQVGLDPRVLYYAVEFARGGVRAMEGTMSEEPADATDLSELPEGRQAAARRWLRTANERLLAIERGRRDLIAAAAAILRELDGRRVRETRPSRPRLKSNLAKTG